MAEVKKSFEDIKKLILPDINVTQDTWSPVIDPIAAKLEKYDINKRSAKSEGFVPFARFTVIKDRIQHTLQ